LYKFSPESSEQFYRLLSFSICAIALPYIMSASAISRKVPFDDISILLVLVYVIFLIGISAIDVEGYIPIIKFAFVEANTKAAIDYYSQGLTGFLSVGVIACVFKISRDKLSAGYKAGIIAVALCLWILSLASGGRGEVIACAVTVFIILCRSWKTFIAVLIMLAMLLYGVDVLLHDAGTLSKFPVIWRFLDAYEAASWGERDLLWSNAWSLLGQNPSCILFGCGLNFFQEYYHFEFGIYPHNWIIEFIISFGVLLLIAVAVLVGVYIARNYKNFNVNERFLVFLSVFFFMISLKSLSLLGNPLLYGAVFSVLFSVRGPQRDDASAPTNELAPAPLGVGSRG